MASLFSIRPGFRPGVLDAIAVLTIVAVAIVALLTFRDYGLGWDDFTHAEMGDLLLALYGSGFQDRRAFSFVNLYLYGGGFDMAAALLAKILPFDLFEVRRLAGALVGVVGLIVVWRLGRRIGGPLNGAIATVLLATCPLYYGHMFINPKDSPFAVAMALLLLGLVRAFQEYPRPAPSTTLLFGMGLGFTVGSRIMGAMAALYAIAPQLVLLRADAAAEGLAGALRAFGRFVLALLPGLVVAYLLMGLVWPWSVLAPLNPFRAAAYFEHFFETPWRELYAGDLISVPDMPWTYLRTLLGLKLPELFVALALAGAALAGLRAVRSSVPVRERAVLLLLLGAVFVPILLTLATRPALYNGIRHFVFLLPPMAVLGGLSGAWILERLSRRSAVAACAGGAVILAGVLSPVVEIVRLHPLEYTHFNRIAGGVKGADGRYMLDYWGLSFKEAADELRARLAAEGAEPPDGKRWTIAVCGPHPPARVALGPRFELTWDSRGADFALMLGVFYCRQLDAPLIAEVRREGVVFARAYDLRGRSVPSLLTMPPP